MRIWKEFRFEAAHRLPFCPPEHKCSRLHGHSFRFRIHVEGEPDPTLGWVTDFGGPLRAVGEQIVRLLDHTCLNDHLRLQNPTAENLALYIWSVASSTIFGEPSSRVRLVAVEVQETEGAGVWYYGP